MGTSGDTILFSNISPAFTSCFCIYRKKSTNKQTQRTTKPNQTNVMFNRLRPNPKKDVGLKELTLRTASQTVVPLLSPSPPLPPTSHLATPGRVNACEACPNSTRGDVCEHVQSLCTRSRGWAAGKSNSLYSALRRL